MADRGDLGVRHGDLRVERGEIQMLLVLLRAVVAPREREDQRVVALELAEFARCIGVIGELVIRKDAPGTMSERMVRLLWDLYDRVSVLHPGSFLRLVTSATQFRLALQPYTRRTTRASSRRPRRSASRAPHERIPHV